jgi:hypothetical protein
VRMSSFRLLAASLAIACVSATAPTAGATVLDRDVGFDERDIEPRPGRDPDIRWTMRKLAINDGRRVFTIVVRFYEDHPRFGLEIRLDALGGPQVDHIMSVQTECAVWRKGHRRDHVTGRSHLRGGRFVCRVPARAVSPMKSIRWKVRTTVPDGSRRDTEFEIDYAPSDRGWYPG